MIFKYELRPIQYDDLTWLREWFTDKETKQRMGGMLPLEDFYNNTKEISNINHTVALGDETIYAFVSTETDEQDKCYISIIVNPNYRRQGIGYQVINEICRLHAKYNIYASIETNNTPSISLFTKCGFVNSNITVDGYANYIHPGI